MLKRLDFKTHTDMHREKTMSKYVFIAIISSVLFGFTTIIQKRTTGVDPITFTLLSMISGTVLIFVYWLFFTPNKVYSSIGMYRSLWAGMLSGLAFTLFIIALRHYKVSTVVIINSFSAVVAVLLSVILLTEKLSITQIIGVILGISGVILVSI
jgi:uncharacterized membrane protein